MSSEPPRRVIGAARVEIVKMAQPPKTAGPRAAALGTALLALLAAAVAGPAAAQAPDQAPPKGRAGDDRQPP